MDWKWLLLSREGRIPRKVYWLNFVLPVTIIGMIIGVVEQVVGLGDGDTTTLLSQPLSALFSLAVIWPSICVSAKRCHDRDKSAWWILINFVPLVGVIWWVIEFGCLRGTIGPNRFGPDPVAPTRLASPA